MRIGNRNMIINEDMRATIKGILEDPSQLKIKQVEHLPASEKFTVLITCAAATLAMYD